MQIDLHGTKHEDVIRKIDMFIWECIQNNTSQGKIITGNSQIMKQIVTSCLAEHGLTPNNLLANNNVGSITFDL